MHRRGFLKAASAAAFFAVLLSCAASYGAVRASAKSDVTLRIDGDAERPLDLTVDQLRERFKADLKSVRFKIKDRETTYQAVPLQKIIEAAAPKANPAVKNHALAFALLVTAKDGYVVQLSWGELLPDYGAREVYLALAEEGEGGPARLPRLLVVGDKRLGRCTHDVQRIRIIDGIKLANAKEQ